MDVIFYPWLTDHWSVFFYKKLTLDFKYVKTIYLHSRFPFSEFGADHQEKKYGQKYRQRRFSVKFRAAAHVFSLVL